MLLKNMLDEGKQAIHSACGPDGRAYGIGADLGTPACVHGSRRILGLCDGRALALACSSAPTRGSRLPELHARHPGALAAGVRLHLGQVHMMATCPLH